MDYDVVVVGAGHNGLVSACYLAKSGLKVAVVERRSVIGGAASTEEVFEGYQVDIGSGLHVLFPTSGIGDELGLHDFGLEYLEVDPWAFYPVLGTDTSITFYRDLDKTCASIAQINERDADAYRAFMTKWLGIQDVLWPLLSNPPGTSRLVSTALRHPGNVRSALKSEDAIRGLLMDANHLVQETFESEELKAALLWLAAQNGPNPDVAGSTLILGNFAMMHRSGAYRAKGGAGMLSVALGHAFESLGGTIIAGEPVESVTRGSTSRYEVRTAERALPAKSVLFACHVQTALLHLLDRDLIDPKTVRRLEALKVMNGSGIMVRQAVDELPAYPGQHLDDRGVGECHHGMQLLLPSTDTLLRATNLGRAGRTPDVPPVMQMSFTSIDPTLAPEGKHLLYSWSSYHPYELAEGKWDDIAEREADKIWDVVCRYAPNMEGKLIDRYIQHPLELERKIGMLRGDVGHIEMSFDQLLGARPLPEMSGYKTPIDGIYLTGASTHPGGGVWGASDRNAAKVVLKDVR